MALRDDGVEKPDGPAPRPTLLSVFDLDRTLTRLPTYLPFLLYAAWQRAPERLLLLPALLAPALAYARGSLPRARMKERMHALLLGKALSAREVHLLAEGFAERLVRAGIYRQALDLIAADRAEGRRIILATAAPRFYAAALAGRLGIGEVVATDCDWRETYLTPHIVGENCYGDAKCAMLADHLSAGGIERDRAHIRFYSDHCSDLPTFDYCDEPVAVNPSPRLRAVAVDRGWRILDWRGSAAAARALWDEKNESQLGMAR
ncbi:HAD family hydrolase [Flavisphingomonas formosensis]|uniref:HAD family hydrolase n=1 Tax=Flavisphingomonas formosensis TaxID=861534 RepID=UPI0012F908BF|nr:HAD-IB family hydrolase [Sphingomonas formosensis]